MEVVVYVIGSVQWFMKNDPQGRLCYAPLQGETAAQVRMEHPEIPRNLDSVLFVERDGKQEIVYWRSQAVFRIAAHLQTRWRFLSWLRVIPAFLSDLAYRAVAAIRYRLWGSANSCRVLGPEEQRRFLP